MLFFIVKVAFIGLSVKPRVNPASLPFDLSRRKGYNEVMNEFLKMDWFFAVTTLAVITVGALLAVVLMRAWRILGNIEHISKNVSEESDSLRADIGDLRAKAKSGGARIGHLAGLFSSFFGSKRDPRKKK